MKVVSELLRLLSCLREQALGIVVKVGLLVRSGASATRNLRLIHHRLLRVTRCPEGRHREGVLLIDHRSRVDQRLPLPPFSWPFLPLPFAFSPFLPLPFALSPFLPLP